MAGEGEVSDSPPLQTKPGCIFCKIVTKEETNTRIEFEDDSFVIFADLKPAAKHHYLVVPRNHHGNPKSLKKADVQLVEDLVQIGMEFMRGIGEDLVADIRVGFHWPPFNSIEHLHLHVIAPASQMGFFSRQIHKPQTFWFVTADWMLNHLRNMPD